MRPLATGSRGGAHFAAHEARAVGADDTLARTVCLIVVIKLPGRQRAGALASHGQQAGALVPKSIPGWFEPERQRVDAVAQPGGVGAVVEDMP